MTTLEIERPLRSPDLKAQEVMALTPNDVVQVYSGKAGACCCGCAGNYRASITAFRLADDIEEAEVNQTQVKKVLNIVQRAVLNGTAQFGSNHASVVIGSRLYVVYPFKSSLLRRKA